MRDPREAQLRPLVERARERHRRHAGHAGWCRECIALEAERELLDANSELSAGDAFELAWAWLKERHEH